MDGAGTGGDGSGSSSDRQEVSLPTVQLAATSREQACALVVHAVLHLLFAKGQVDQPISLLRRRRERERQLNSSKSRMRLTARRRDRKAEELLQSLDEIERQVQAAIEHRAALHDIKGKGRRIEDVDDPVHLLIRLGQSPLTLPKQQYLIHCTGITSLLARSSLSPDDGEKAPVNPDTTRRAFGTRAADSSKEVINGTKTYTNDARRQQALERKLVRFLLNATSEDDALGRALNKTLHPCKTQILLAGRTGAYPPTWIPRPSMHLANDDIFEHSHRSVTNTDAVQETLDDAEAAKPEELEQLVEALSPVKRRRVVVFSADSDDEGAERPARSVATVPDALRDALSNHNAPVTKQEFVDLDDKRAARLRARQAQQSVAKEAGTKRGDDARRVPACVRKSAKGIITSASFVLDFRPDDQDRLGGPRTLIRNDEVWHASRTVIRGLT